MVPVSLLPPTPNLYFNVNTNKNLKLKILYVRQPPKITYYVNLTKYIHDL